MMLLRRMLPAKTFIVKQEKTNFLLKNFLIQKDYIEMRELMIIIMTQFFFFRINSPLT